MEQGILNLHLKMQHSILVVAGKAQKLENGQKQVQNVQIHTASGHHLVIFVTANEAAGVKEDETREE